MPPQHEMPNIDFSELISLRDIALEASFNSGKVRRFGSFTVGVVIAIWSIDNSSFTLLADRQTFIGNRSLRRYRTILGMAQEHGKLFELTAYAMNLEQGQLLVSRSIISDENMDRDVKSATFPKRKELELGLASTTTEDHETILEELRRGASGMYAAPDL